MRYATTDHLRVDQTIEAFFQAVSGMPVKESAIMAEVADPTVGRWRKKEVDPSVRPFLLMVRRLPLHLKRTILGPVLDDLGALDNAMRLSAMASSLKEMAEHVDEISRANRAGRGGLRDVLGFGRAAGAGVDAEPTGLCGDVGGGDGDAGGELDSSALALVQTKRPASILAGDDLAQLRRHLTALDNVVSLDAARSLAQADNTGHTGLAVQRPGEDWWLWTAPANRLWRPSNDPRRISDFAGDQAGLRRDLEEAAASPAPIVVTHAGGFIRDGELMQFRSTVVRVGGRSTCGARLALTDFARRVAA